MTPSNVVLCAAVRTAVGTNGGALKGTPAVDLGAAAIRAAIERAGLKGSDVDALVMGQVVQAGAKMNPARQAAIKAGLPVNVPALIAEIGWSQDLVNVEGGAIAHGHLIGVTGAVLTTRLLHAMKRDNVRRGMVTLCIGGGQGVALALDSIR